MMMMMMDEAGKVLIKYSQFSSHSKSIEIAECHAVQLALRVNCLNWLFYGARRTRPTTEDHRRR